MPETYGKRQRRNVRERKIAAREERRVARGQRRDMRAAGLLPPGPAVAPAEPELDDLDDARDADVSSEPPRSGR
jgi:hypothetical protein